MTWRLAKSLETLQTQINAAAHDRRTTADGSIGDAAHASGWGVSEPRAGPTSAPMRPVEKCRRLG
jgi:hypothetical protein